MWGTKDAHLPVDTSHMQPSLHGRYICLWILQRQKKKVKNLSRIVYRAAHFKDILVTAQLVILGGGVDSYKKERSLLGIKQRISGSVLQYPLF